MKHTIHLITQDSNDIDRKFESVDAALKMNPIIVIEEKIDDDDKYSYCLYNSKGETTDIIKIGSWKIKLTGVSNVKDSYPYIYFDLIDPNGEIERYNPGNRAKWAFKEAVSALREANNFSNHKIFQVFEKNKQINYELEKLKKENERLKLEIEKITRGKEHSE